MAKLSPATVIAGDAPLVPCSAPMLGNRSFIGLLLPDWVPQQPVITGRHIPRNHSNFPN